MSDRRLRNVRGNEVSVIFQEPMTSLDPAFTIGNQLMEAYRNHKRRIEDRGAGRAPRRCSGSSGSPSRRGGSASIPTTSRAACASA